MKRFLTLIPVLLLPQLSAAQDTVDYLAAKTALREVYDQLNFMNQALGTIPGPPEGRGLYDQVDRISWQLIVLKNKIAAKESAESLYIQFNKLDMPLQTLLKELQNFDVWNKPLAFVSRRLAAAENDLAFALGFTDPNPKKQGDALYRHTLGLQGRAEALLA